MNKRICLFIGIGIACLYSLIGCAPPSIKPVEPQKISPKFEKMIQQEVSIVPIIDGRQGREKDAKDVFGIPKSYPDVEWQLEKNGYITKILKVASSDCGSLKDVDVPAQIPCLKRIINDDVQVALFMSVDEYVPQGGLSMAAKVSATGLLYDRASNSIVWKNRIGGDTGEETLMYSGVGGLLVKAMAPDVMFRNAAMLTISTLVRTVPPCPKEKRLRDPSDTNKIGVPY